MFTPERERESGAFGLTGTGYHQARECQRAIGWLVKMAERCVDEDVTDACGPALDYLHRHISRPILTKRYLEALRVPDRAFRRAAAFEALKGIARAAPRYYDTK